MNTASRSFRQFNVRANRNQAARPLPDFTSGLVQERGEEYALVNDDEVIAAALRILSKRLVSGPALTSPAVVREYLALRLAGLEHEVFTCLYLDNRHRVIACEELFRGTVDGASVHPREVVKHALAHNAAAVIFAHNHPSGIAEPSQADELITRRLKDALALVEIHVLDHFVVGGATVESFSERGLL